ncbi:uncharacterized protein LOC142345697 isoform X2 [Convolutriloba macropyga]|uniref:uncharacterized protein LOC142345697 isoform X2 n=1 Tax=Convolutriloba macropyga TaxID=536237 RepID=UPI003F522155
MCVNIVNIGLFLLFYSFNLAFSSEDFLHYYITHTSSEIFVDFIKDTMSAESARYCGLYCIQFTYCKSFNYHLKFHMCHLLVTDSRLLQQEDQLGPSIYKKGLDWKHGEPHPSVQGCDWEVSARECCFIYLYGNETTHNLTSQWSLPTNNNIRYAVDLVIRTTNENSVCITGTFPAETKYDAIESSRVKTYIADSLIPGINYTFQLSAWYKKESGSEEHQAQSNMSHSAATLPAAPVEVTSLRDVQIHSVEITVTVEGCAESIFYWYEPGTSCTKASPCTLTGSNPYTNEFTNLTAGQDYFFYFQTFSNGHYSDKLIVNQPTYTDVMIKNEIRAATSAFVLEFNFEGGVGSVVNFSYLGYLAVGAGSEIRPFSVENEVEFEDLEPGDRFDATIKAYSKGNEDVRLMTEYTKFTFLKPPPPLIVEGTLVADWSDFSIHMELDFTYGHTAHVEIIEEESSLSPWSADIHSVQQSFTLADIIPGKLFTAKMHPTSPFNIEGDFSWANVSMHTDNITYDFTEVQNFSLVLETTIPSGRGQELNITVTPVFIPLSQETNKSYDFTSLTRISTWNQLTPGDIYMFEVKAYSEWDEYTPPEVQTLRFNQSTLPALPLSIPDDVCDLSAVDTGGIYSLNWVIKYGDDNETDVSTATTWVHSFIQVGIFTHITFVIKNSTSGENVTVIDYDPFNDPRGTTPFFNTSTDEYTPLSTGEKYTLQVHALSAGTDRNSVMVAWDTVLLPKEHVPDIIYTSNSQTTLSYANMDYKTAKVAYWRHGDFSSAVTLEFDDVTPSRDVPMQIGDFFWVAFQPVGGDFAGLPSFGYLMSGPVMIGSAACGSDNSDLVPGLDADIYMYKIGNPDNDETNEETLVISWAQPSLIDEARITVVQTDTGEVLVNETVTPAQLETTLVMTLESYKDFQVDIELPNTIGVTKTSEVKKTAIEAMGCVANLIFGTGGSTSLTLFYICPSQIIDCDGNVYNVSEQYFASWEYGEFEAGTYVDLVGTGEIFLDVPVGAMRRYTMVAVLQNGSLIDETNGLIYSRVVPIDSSISDITFGDFLLSTYMVTIQTSAVCVAWIQSSR